eukprot:m.43204 g.43204  ORF g.43204 m.43204 type:complete len:770 (-) comp11623_c0_seq2:1441-3750(-)
MMIVAWSMLALAIVAVGANPVCLNSPAVSVCVDPTTGWWTSLQYGGGALQRLLPGSGLQLLDCDTLDANVTFKEQILWVSRTLQCAPNFYHDVNNPTALVTETMTLNPDDASIDWNATVVSDSSKPWSTAVTTSLLYAAFDNATAWVGGPHRCDVGLPSPTFNPLEPFQVSNSDYGDFYYGGKITDINHSEQVNCPATIIPVLSRLDASSGVSVLQSLRDTPIVAYTKVGKLASAGVGLNFTRQYFRLGALTAPLKIHQHIVAHEACWRPAVAWLQKRYPTFFAADRRANVTDIEGTGSYADLRGASDMSPADAKHYQAMDYRLNWDSTARFPWHGEWIPTAADGFNDTWLCCFAHAKGDTHYGEPCSNPGYGGIASWYQHQRDLGFRTCAYGNLFEFGWAVADVWPNKTLDCTPPLSNSSLLQCHTQRLLREKYGEALLYNVRDPSKLVCGGLDGSCVMDPHPSLPYHDHLLDMVETSLTKTPSAGLCIDRQDWLGSVNPQADDGVTWYPVVPFKTFAPVRAMINSWKPALKNMADILHANNKVVVINDHANRLDLMEHVDGIYAEMGDVTVSGFQHALGSALASMNTPAYIWNHGTTKNLEQGLQGHLFAGVYPTVPVRNNDHSIGGDCAPHCPYDALFADYGPLFAALHGKRWVLTATPSLASNGQSNVFTTTKGIAAVVVAGEARVISNRPGQRGDAAAFSNLVLRVPPDLSPLPSSARVLQPGVPASKAPAVTLSVETKALVLVITIDNVPLVRGIGAEENALP